MPETTTTTHIGTSSRLSVRAVNDYIRKEIRPMNRLSVSYAELSSRGRVKYRCGGNQIEWRPTLSARKLRAGAGNPSDVVFNQTTTEKVCQLPYRTYDMGEHVTKFERLATQGQAGYFGPILKIVKDLSADFMRDYRPKFYADGNATGDEDIHGLESWFGVNGCVTNSVFGDPSDNYAGLSTALGVTGSWTPETGNGWPTGGGDVEYCSFSPFVVDFNNPDLGGTVADWEHQWQTALATCMTYMLVLQSVQPQTCLMAPSLLNEAKRSLQPSQRFTTTADSNLTRLGFKTLEYDGVEIATEYGIPDRSAYLVSWDQLELRVMGSQLIEMEEDYDIRTGQRLYKLDTYQNLVCESPAFQGKLAAISAEGT